MIKLLDIIYKTLLYKLTIYKNIDLLIYIYKCYVVILSYIVIYEGERGCGGEREFFDRTKKREYEGVLSCLCPLSVFTRVYYLDVTRNSI